MSRAMERTFLGAKAGDPAEPGRQVLAIAIPAFGLRSQAPKLAIQNCPLEFPQAVIARDHVMLIPHTARHAPAVVNGTALGSQPIIVRRKDSAFPCRKIFARLK